MCHLSVAISVLILGLHLWFGLVRRQVWLDDSKCDTLSCPDRCCVTILLLIEELQCSITCMDILKHGQMRLEHWWMLVDTGTFQERALGRF